ncbi:hypothetical protein GSI_03011 [Ganoderma sinense ZZ0214-1]|uniref:Uncharacterized protein n=1 Tax=Ganoderma sinense ZZ0214-1 TaxID=1077348 RepID=A0A2G8SN85_9APHY|nr:hypothetical protein GSI_03011 [Ganoderma sinense ZZ0214-1]
MTDTKDDALLESTTLKESIDSGMEDTTIMEPSIWATQKQWKKPFKKSSQTPLRVNGKKLKEQSSRIFTSIRRIKPRNTEDSHWTYLKTILRSLQLKVRAPHLQRYMNMLNQDWGYPFHNGVNHKEPLKSQEKEKDQVEREHQELAKILTKTANLTLETLEGLADLKGLEDLTNLEDREDQEDQVKDREVQEDRVVEDQEDLVVEDQEDLVVEDREDQEGKPYRPTWRTSDPLHPTTGRQS